MSPHNHPPVPRATSRQREGVWSDPAVQLRPDRILAFFVLNSDASRGFRATKRLKSLFSAFRGIPCATKSFLTGYMPFRGVRTNLRIIGKWMFRHSRSQHCSRSSYNSSCQAPPIIPSPPVIATGPCVPGRERPPSAVKPRTMFERVILKDDGHDGDSPRRTMPVRARHPYGESNVQGKSLY